MTIKLGINQNALAEIETERNRYLGFMGNLCDYCLKPPGAVNRKAVVDTTVSLLA